MKNILLDNKYIIKSLKGKGGTSKVFLVEELKTNKIYASKILLHLNLPYIPYFNNEIEILNYLKDKNIPNIIKIIDSGEGDIILDKTTVKKKYIILDYAEKGDLSEYIFLLEKPLIEKHAKFIFSEILEGVKDIHKNKVCHRDLKTANVLLDKNFNPKIADFGFSTYITSNKIKGCLGTYRYAAPEVLSDKYYDGVKIDIFSLGVILFDLVTGKSGGFKEARLKDPLYKLIMQKSYPSFWKKLTQVKDVSEEFKNLYVKMVAKNPEERPSIDDILKDKWMEEIIDIKKDEKKKEDLKIEIYEELLERENVINSMKSKERKTEKKEDNGNNGNRSLGQENHEYFKKDLIPRDIKEGKIIEYYYKIKGDLNPVEFMNKLANIILFVNNNKCQIEEKKNKLKFEVIFEDDEEEENIEDDKNNEENNENENEINDNDNETICKKDSIIKIELFKYGNKEHLLRFMKKSGEKEDYYKHIKSLYSCVEKLL